MRNSRMTILMVSAILIITGSQGFGLTEFKDGGMHDISSTINDDVWVDYLTPDMQTTVNLLNGGYFSPSYSLRGYNDSRINMFGGSVSGNLLAYDNSQVTMTGGTVGQVLGTNDSSQVTMSGGSVDELFAAGGGQVTMSGGSVRGLFAIEGGQATMSGGSVGEYLYATGVSQVTLSGGSVDGYLFAHHSGHVNWSGGTIAGNVILDDQAILTITGANFAIDGIPFGFGEITSILGGSYSFEPFGRLTGTLANGEIINNHFQIGDYAKIVLIPEPASLLLLALGGMLIRKR